MIKITQLKVKIPHSEDAVKKKACHLLRISPQDINAFRILRRSIDARNKPELYYTYTVEISTPAEKRILKKNRHKNIMQSNVVPYQFPEAGPHKLQHPPVIIGSGPAGLFCAWMLAAHGYRPILLERGEAASQRRKTVQTFWDTGILQEDSNVQFGEGGAGTFSDGKLNTGVKDPSGRNHLVLELFHKAGAPEEILYEAKPHLGTDLLVSIVETLRNQIISMGGEVHFRSKVTDLLIRDGRVAGVCLADKRTIPAQVVIPAIGHSARDTYQMLYRHGLSMRMKPIAVGVRAEHPQEMINLQQYGAINPEGTGAADYKLTARLSSGRSAYTFCMCPGGFVVNASSEPGMLSVNGMSYHARDARNANSAIVVTVSPEDYLRMRAAAGADGSSQMPEALCGLDYVRMLERNAFLAASGQIPVQRYADFCDALGFSLQKSDSSFSGWLPNTKGSWKYADVHTILPAEIAAGVAEGIGLFDQKLHGFAHPDTLLSGVESRTSSPVRIDRNARFESNIRGIYPCGEGAGYAGGITSAAMDGIKTAEAVASVYQNFV